MHGHHCIHTRAPHSDCLKLETTLLLHSSASETKHCVNKISLVSFKTKKLNSGKKKACLVKIDSDEVSPSVASRTITSVEHFNQIPRVNCTADLLDGNGSKIINQHQ